MEELVLRIAKKSGNHDFSDEFLVGLCELGVQNQFAVDQTGLHKLILLHLEKEGYSPKKKTKEET